MFCIPSPEEIDDVRREVQIMHHLAGHPNVVCIRGVYEDKVRGQPWGEVWGSERIVQG